MAFSRQELEVQHELSSMHRKEVEDAGYCGCCYCQESFPADKIDSWIDSNSAGEGQTAICPLCGIDAIIPSQNGEPIDGRLLEAMHQQYFD